MDLIFVKSFGNSHVSISEQEGAIIKIIFYTKFSKLLVIPVTRVAINTEKDRNSRKGPKRTENDRKDTEKDRKDTEKDRKDTEKDHNDTVKDSRRKLDVTRRQIIT